MSRSLSSSSLFCSCFLFQDPVGSQQPVHKSRQEIKIRRGSKTVKMKQTHEYSVCQCNYYLQQQLITAIKSSKFLTILSLTRKKFPNAGKFHFTQLKMFILPTNSNIYNIKKNIHISPKVF